MCEPVLRIFLAHGCSALSVRYMASVTDNTKALYSNPIAWYFFWRRLWYTSAGPGVRGKTRPQSTMRGEGLGRHGSRPVSAVRHRMPLFEPSAESAPANPHLPNPSPRHLPPNPPPPRPRPLDPPPRTPPPLSRPYMMWWPWMYFYWTWMFYWPYMFWWW